MVFYVKTCFFVPESPAGTGDADGFEPPKRLLKIAAIIALGTGTMGVDEVKG
jgi:hypothetical protein